MRIFVDRFGDPVSDISSVISSDAASAATDISSVTSDIGSGVTNLSADLSSYVPSSLESGVNDLFPALSGGDLSSLSTTSLSGLSSAAASFEGVAGGVAPSGGWFSNLLSALTPNTSTLTGKLVGLGETAALTTGLTFGISQLFGGSGGSGGSTSQQLAAIASGSQPSQTGASRQSGQNAPPAQSSLSGSGSNIGGALGIAIALFGIYLLTKSKK